MGECDSRFLKSTTPRITNLFDDDLEHFVENIQCPFHKGIIYYSRGTTIFEHNIYRKHEPRILSPPSYEGNFLKFRLIPIERNRVLLMRRFESDEEWFTDEEHPSDEEWPSDKDEELSTDEEWPSDEERPSNPPLIFEPNEVSHFELSIHEICHYRVGPALWTYHGDSGKPDLMINDLKSLRSPTDILGVTFDNNCITQIKLFAMEFGDGRYRHLLIDEAELLHLRSRMELGAIGCSPNGWILVVRLPDDETIGMFHSSSANTGFNLVSQVPIPQTGPVPYLVFFPPPAFSADGSKFAVAAKDGTVSVWDVRNKTPFVVKEPDREKDDMPSLQFSSGTLGREVLALVGGRGDRTTLIHLIDPRSFEIEETLDLAQSNPLLGTLGPLFFDPNGETMYAEGNGRLYEWKLQEREGPEWWLGEGYDA